MRPLHTIVVHCSATRPNWMIRAGIEAQRAEIDRWHRARGFEAIGYHYLIGRDGSVVEGRPLETTGAHVKGHNTGSVGICLVGGLWPDGRDSARGDSFGDHFTPAQDGALRRLIASLQTTYPAITTVVGHNDLAPRGCPGFTVRDWLAGAQDAPATCPCCGQVMPASA